MWDRTGSRKIQENILNHLQIMVGRDELAANHIRWANNCEIINENRIAYLTFPPSAIEVDQLHLQLSVLDAYEQIAIPYVTMNQILAME